MKSGGSKMVLDEVMIKWDALGWNQDEVGWSKMNLDDVECSQDDVEFGWCGMIGMNSR